MAKKKKKEKAYCLVRDEGCDWYVIPTERRSEFHTLVEDGAWEYPEWAKFVELYSFTFDDWER